MSVILDPFGWGDCQTRDIDVVLNSAISEFSKAGITVDESICVFPTIHDYPQVLTAKGPRGEHSILLTVRGRKWDAYVYEFAHEYCHVFTKHHQTPLEHKNSWLDEVICETASLWCLSKMSDTWQSSPPYENWTEYAKNFAIYADQKIEGCTAQEDEINFKDWFSAEIASLQENSLQREKNRKIAIQFLDIANKEPNFWVSTTEINDSQEVNVSADTYLNAWLNRSAFKETVQLIIDLLFINRKEENTQKPHA